MASLHTSLLAGLLVLHLFLATQGAPVASSQPVASKDTLRDPSLQQKLDRIHALLSQLDSEASDGDQDSDAPGTRVQQHEKGQAQEKEMRSLGQEDRKKFKVRAQSLKKHSSHKVPTPARSVSPTDDSMQILAQALARLQLSQTEETEKTEEKEETESDGERMGTGYNERRKVESAADETYDKDEAGRQLEQTIAGALARLQGGDELQTKLKRPEPPSYKDFHDEALRVVESRLLRDLALADRLGLSVDDLIQDLEEQESREEILQKLENSLAALVGDRDE